MPFIPKPKVNQSTILVIGVLIYVLSYLWLPFILVISYALSRLLPYFYRENDDATARRKLWKKFEQQSDNCLDSWKNLHPDVVLNEKYWVNERGLCLLTSTMVPKDQPISCVVCYCHGYCDNASFMRRVEYQRFVKRGIAVISIEHEGHGRSDGLLGYIPSMDNLVSDAATFFEETTNREFQGKKRFLIGESMGAAICYSAYNKNPKIWSGVVLIAPMCKIKEENLPPKFILNLMNYFCGDGENFIGTLPIIPGKDVTALSNKIKEKREIISMVPYCYSRNPRVKTAQQILNFTLEISKSMSHFDAPFLIQHGKKDKVTSPNMSQMFYDQAISKDKEILLYDDMWHSFISEPDKNIEKCFDDAISWVLNRI